MNHALYAIADPRRADRVVTGVVVSYPALGKFYPAELKKMDQELDVAGLRYRIVGDYRSKSRAEYDRRRINASCRGCLPASTDRLSEG